MKTPAGLGSRWGSERKWGRRVGAAGRGKRGDARPPTWGAKAPRRRRSRLEPSRGATTRRTPSVSPGVRGGRSGSERKKGRGGGRTDKGKTPPPPDLGGDGATAQPRRGATAQRPHHASPAVTHACHSHLRKRRRLPPPRPTSSAKTGSTKTCQNLVAIIDATSAIQVLRI